MKKEELRYLQRLAELYPTIAKASTEIINLQSILNLPKGTEHFMSDIHGEYDAFSHVLRNGSGAVRKKIDDVFEHTLSNSDKRSLATLIYYPKEKMEVVKKQEEDMENWYKITLYRLIEVCKTTASKYTRSKVVILSFPNSGEFGAAQIYHIISLPLRFSSSFTEKNARRT